MGQNLPGRHYGRAFGIFLVMWVSIGLFALFGVIAYMSIAGSDPQGSVLTFGGVCIATFGVVLYSAPSVIACASVHPSRSAIYLLNWVLGWTGLGWLGALLWALAGANARGAELRVVPAPEAFSSSQNVAVMKEDSLIRPISWVFAIGCLLVLGFLVRQSHSPASKTSDPDTEVSAREAEGNTESADVGEEKSGYATALESHRKAVESYEGNRAEFQRRFPTLEMPARNLRWYPNLRERWLLNKEIIDLVSPYGPCAELLGNKEYGYSVVAVDFNPYEPAVPVEILAGELSLQDARETAIARCLLTYRTLREKPIDPIRENHLWFAPELPDVEQSGLPSTQMNPVPLDSTESNTAELQSTQADPNY